SRRHRREENQSPEKGRHEADERGGDGPSPIGVLPATVEVGTGGSLPVHWQAVTSKSEIRNPKSENSQSVLASAAARLEEKLGQLDEAATLREVEMFEQSFCPLIE